MQVRVARGRTFDCCNHSHSWKLLHSCIDMVAAQNYIGLVAWLLPEPSWLVQQTTVGVVHYMLLENRLLLDMKDREPIDWCTHRHY